MKRFLIALACLTSAACTCSKATTEAPASAPPQPVLESQLKMVGLPPVDDTCGVDQDCTYVRMYLVDGKCCSGTCGVQAASKAYEKSVEATCTALGYAEANCPAKKCASLPRPKCVAGHCVQQ